MSCCHRNAHIRYRNELDTENASGHTTSQHRTWVCVCIFAVIGTFAAVSDIQNLIGLWTMAELNDYNVENSIIKEIHFLICNTGITLIWMWKIKQTICSIIRHVFSTTDSADTIKKKIKKHYTHWPIYFY